MFFFFSSRRRHTRYWRDWSSDVCSSDLRAASAAPPSPVGAAGSRLRPPGSAGGFASPPRRAAARGARSVARSAELVDDALRDPASCRYLDAVGLGPLPDGGGADVRLARPGRASATGSSWAVTAGLTGGLNVAGKSPAQRVGMLVGQVNLVSRAVEAEADDLAVAVLDDGLEIGRASCRE